MRQILWWRCVVGFDGATVCEVNSKSERRVGEGVVVKRLEYISVEYGVDVSTWGKC